MKRLYVLFLFLAAIFVTSFISSAVIYAEEGEWIEHPLTVGITYNACGEDCIGITGSSATSILFFDIYKSAWTELEFDTQQTIHDLEAEGHTVFSYSDELLIGYSALKSRYDTIQYVGTPLLLSSPPFFRCYGAGKNLAFFVTDERMYVFDAELGYWQEYDYGLPDNYSSPYFYVKDDYVAVFLLRGFYEQPKNVVYSLHTHDFNKLENGCHKPYVMLDHGFARWHQHGGSGDDYQLTGYNAYTNEFDVVQVSDQGYLRFSNVEASGLKADEVTAYAVSFRQVIEPYVLVRADFYGYDTHLGYWSHVTIDFDSQVERYYGSWQHGGQFVVDNSIYSDTGVYHFIIYSGLTGLFKTMKPGLIYGSTTSFTRCGGTVFVVADSLTGSAWGYDLITELGSMILIDGETTRLYPLSGDDYITFTRYSDASDMMTVYFYNGTSRNWTTTQMHKTVSSGGESYNKHIYVFNSYDSPTRETIFYSSILDKYVKCQFPVDSYVYLDVSSALAYADSSEKSYLFDAQTGVIHELDLQFNQGGIGGVLGDSSASFYDKDTKTLYGYSTISRKWTTLTVEDTPCGRRNQGFIGLISNDTGTQYYTKFYAYNSLKDSWVELIPTGSPVGFTVGEKTALVIRSDALYAFDPDGRAYKEDLLGTWIGQGVYYRNSDTGSWVKMASPATKITAGDIDTHGQAHGT